MGVGYNLCIIKPNKTLFSETFIQEHINRLAGNKKVIYGGAFPLYDHEGRFLIQSKLDLAVYFFQKRVLKRKAIRVRTLALRNYLRREKIDIVFAEYGMVGALVTEACKLAGVPLVIHFHGADAHHIETVNKYMAFYPQSFLYASGIIAVSKDMIAKLQLMGVDAGKIAYIPCGVDTSSFVQIELNAETQNFISVGRFVGKKSPLSVVKAFQKVLSSVPRAELWMVGNGPLFNEVTNYVNASGLQSKVHLTGVLSPEEIRTLMHKMRCFVQHSVTDVNGDKEGTPVTILEAGASGLPVVSTRHAGIKEAVVDSVTGFLIDEHDIQGMANRMIRLATDFELATKMGKAGRLHIIENYEITGQISKLNKVIEIAVLSRHQG